MCRVYECFEKEWFEDAENAGYEALESMNACAPARKGFYLGFIEQTAPHLMVEIPMDVVNNLQYQEWMDNRAYVASLHNKFRRGISVVNVDLEACPI